METYTYKGIADGKYVEGDIEAVNPDEASFKLKEQKVIITNLVRSSKKKKTDKKEKKKSGKSIFGKKKAKVEDVLIFSKQFATMVKAGLPILQVLSMLRDQMESPAMKDVVEDIRKSLEGGVTLSTCFGKFPELFDNVYINSEIWVKGAACNSIFFFVIAFRFLIKPNFELSGIAMCNVLPSILNGATKFTFI